VPGQWEECRELLSLSASAFFAVGWVCGGMPAAEPIGARFPCSGTEGAVLELQMVVTLTPAGLRVGVTASNPGFTPLHVAPSLTAHVAVADVEGCFLIGCQGRKYLPHEVESRMPKLESGGWWQGLLGGTRAAAAHRSSRHCLLLPTPTAKGRREGQKGNLGTSSGAGSEGQMQGLPGSYLWQAGGAPEARLASSFDRLERRLMTMLRCVGHAPAVPWWAKGRHHCRQGEEPHVVQLALPYTDWSRVQYSAVLYCTVLCIVMPPVVSWHWSVGAETLKLACAGMARFSPPTVFPLSHVLQGLRRSFGVEGEGFGDFVVYNPGEGSGLEGWPRFVALGSVEGRAQWSCKAGGWSAALVITNLGAPE